MTKQSGANYKASVREKIAYGSGDGATAFAAVMVGSFSMYYFTDVIGISAAFLGSVLFFTRIFDAITNILMGYVVDKTSTRWGKARPWVLWSAIPLAISTILVFSMPSGWSETALNWYVVIILNLYFLIYTTSNIPYGTLGALITQDSKERNNLNLFRMISFFVMMLVISNVTIPAVNAFGGGARAWQLVAIIYGVFMVAIFMFTFKFTKERVTQTKKDREIKLMKSFKLLITNKYWIMIFGIMLLSWVLLGMMTGTNVYYADYILKDASVVGAMSLFFTIPMLAGFFSMPYLLKFFDRRPLILIGLILVIVGSAMILIKTDSLPLIYGASIIRGLGFAPMMGSAYAMLADTIEYGEWKQGIRNEGMIYSGGTFSTTLAGGLSGAITGWILDFGGHISGKDHAQQPESVYTVIEFIFIHLPIILAVIIFIIMLFYKLDKIYPQIVKDLENRVRN